MSRRAHRLFPPHPGDAAALLLGVAAALLGLLGPLLAEPAPRARFLLVAGGSRPAMTQVSLEAHVDLLRGALEHGRAPAGAARPQGMDGTLLFAAGPGPFPVVQEESDQQEADELRSLLGEVLGQGRAEPMSYRPTRLQRVAGPADRQGLLAALQQEARRVGPGGTLFVYFSGHGSLEAEPYGPTIWLWGDQPLGLADLAVALDELPDPPQVVLSLTQCYAGSFARLLYRGGDPTAGPAAASRCGFFATLGDREATGCTPSWLQEGYDDYTVRLVEALQGRSLAGLQPAGPRDLDRDGRVGLDEAHAYVRLHERSVDVPASTSELWLRDQAAPAGEPLHLGSPFADLLAAARPTERAVLAGLAARLLPGDPAPVLQARYRSELLAAQVGLLDRQYDELARQRDQHAGNLIVALTARWPLLEEPWHARLPAVLERDGVRILEFLRPHPELRAMRRAQAQLDRLDEQRWRLMEQRAWFDRLVRAAENVMLEAALRARGGPAVAMLDRLLACEAWVPPGQDGEARPVPVERVAGRQD